MKDEHGLQSLGLTHSEESDSLPFILCLHEEILLTSSFSKENSAITLEEWVLVLKVFTIAARKSRVKLVL